VVALDVEDRRHEMVLPVHPHDTHDWDSNGPLILLDEPWEGSPRKLMVHSDVNGFFFVLDRTDGKLLLATPLGNQNWTTGYGKDGRPVLTDRADTTVEGTVTLRDRNPEMALGVPGPGVEIILRAAFPGLLRGPQRSHASRNGPAILWRVLWRAARRQAGLDPRHGCATPAQRHGSIRCSAVASAFRHARDRRRTGVLRRERRHITALDSKTGTPIWHFETGPGLAGFTMTYMVGGTQYVVLAGQGGIFSFALTQ